MIGDWMGDWMGDSLGTPAASDKDPCQALLCELVIQANGWLLVQGVQALGNSGLCSGQFSGVHTKVVPLGAPEYLKGA